MPNWTVLAGLLLLNVSLLKCSTYSISEEWVCNVKMSCFECLRLSQCSWCKTAKKCFAASLNTDVCSNDTVIPAKDFGFSIDRNAECSCSANQIPRNCRPAGVTSGEECTGRGDCVCGRCVCNSTIDPEHPTKVILGEFCEYDNFSCDDPDCDEGPYLLNPPNELGDAPEPSAGQD